MREAGCFGKTKLQAPTDRVSQQRGTLEMPTKREKIETELKMSEDDRFADLRRVMSDLDDLEADLAPLQDKARLPRFDRSKPLTEWLTILDVSKELIERVRVCLDTVEAISEGREPPKGAKALLAERNSAEQSALAQLDAIVKAQSIK
jgi:hypothetical protein